MKWSDLILHDGSEKCPVDDGVMVETVFEYTHGMRVQSRPRLAKEQSWMHVLAYRVEVKPVVLHVHYSPVYKRAFTNHASIPKCINLNLIKTGDKWTVEVVNETEGD